MINISSKKIVTAKPNIKRQTKCFIDISDKHDTCTEEIHAREVNVKGEIKVFRVYIFGVIQSEYFCIILVFRQYKANLSAPRF